MWYQPELFDLNDPNTFIKPKSQKRTRKAIDYEALFQQLFADHKPVRFRDIEEASGVSHNAVAQVINTLSLRYAIYEVKRGVYKLYGDEEYGDGINKHVKWDDEDY